MTTRSQFTLAILLIATLAFHVAAAPQQGAFEPDEHTTLLAHFDDQLERADFSRGIADWAGNGSMSTDGYFGKGIDLRMRPLTPDFMNTCADITPRTDGWGFHARGHVDPSQGTFECWVKPADPRLPKLLYSSNFIGAELNRSVQHPEDPARYVGFGLTFNKYAIRYIFPTVAGNCYMGDVNFRDIAGFKQYLSEENWHHFAMTWSQGELVIYIDGRPLFTMDMTNELGLVLLDNPTRFINMSDCIIDELRISDVVRYVEGFEPRWRDGKRPAYAFPGNPDVKRFDPKLLPPATARLRPAPRFIKPVTAKFNGIELQFNQHDGSLIRVRAADQASPAVNEGLVLHKGLERKPLSPRAMSQYRERDGILRFAQEFEGDIVADHRLEGDGNVIKWRITLTNRGKDEAWLEPLLGVPAPMPAVSEFFDGCQPRTEVKVARHRDEYAMTLPFAAAAGAGRFIGVGVSPYVDLSDIVSQWIPISQDRKHGGVLRQGGKLALFAGESFTYEFVLVAGAGDFATLDAIDAFHGQFPKLYRLQPDVTVYSYMPMTQYYASDKMVDMKRLGYAGSFWGHGPGHDKGDEAGTPDWWDNPKFYDDKHYKGYTQRIERMWGNVAQLRQYITMYHRQSYDNFYPVRRFHTCPDLTPSYIVNEVWPGHKPNDDPLCFSQYYLPTWTYYIVNEYNTPLGAHFRNQLRIFFNETKGYCSGFINDMSHAGSLFRHNDPIAQRTAGRSFSRDLGTFVRKAIGRRQRYEEFEKLAVNGSRMTYWSDGGAFSYTLGAFSAGIAIEGAGIYKDLTGAGRYLIPARNMVGEKPFSAMTHTNDDWIGYYLKAEEFTPKSLRDYYRFASRQLSLFALKQGMTLDPASYMWGRQTQLEWTPLMVESAVLGRKIVHGATVNEPLWVRRSGNDLDTLLIVGNQQPKALSTEVKVSNRYFKAAPLFVPYFGGEAVHDVQQEKTTISGVRVDARDLAAFTAAAMLDTAGSATATARCEGDGIRMRIELDINTAEQGELMVRTFGPMYHVRRVTINGSDARLLEDEPLALAAGRSQVVVEYQNVALDFTADQWRQVELIKDGRTNFEIVANAGVTYTVDPNGGTSFMLGYERGTAAMLNEFIEQYDDEDGVVGNLKPAPFKIDRTTGGDTWAVVFSQTADADRGRVRIEPESRTVFVEGPTQGEMRRAMTVWMRLVDRKYPHVGRFHPLRDRKQTYDADKPVPLDKWVMRAKTREFFEKVGEQDARFMVKPILSDRYEHLYADDNMDFAGKYEMTVPPRVVEPTYADSFVHGYSGEGKAYTREEMERRQSPQQASR